MNAKVKQSVINQALLAQALSTVTDGENLDNNTICLFADNHNIIVKGEFSILTFDDGSWGGCRTLEHVEVKSVVLEDEDETFICQFDKLPDDVCEYELAQLAFGIKDEIDPVHAFEDLSPKMQEVVLRAGA